MVQSSAQTVTEYLTSLPPERRTSIETIRKVILKNLPKGYEEVMQYGMIGYIVPFSLKPDTYNGQPLCYVALASQKNHLSLYLTNVYSDQKLSEWFTKEYKKSGKKLDMGKSCVRFKKLEDLPLDLIGKTVAMTPVNEFISLYDKARNQKRD